MIFLHIVPVNPYGKKYVSFVSKNFDNQTHLFIYFSEKADEELESFNSNSCIVMRILRWDSLENFLNRYIPIINHVFMHSLFFDPKILFKIKEVLRKFGKDRDFSWVLWGGDLYNYYLSNSQNPNDWFLNELKKIIVNDAYSIIALMEEDYYFAKEKFGTKAKCQYAFYPIIISIEDLEKLVIESKKSEELRENSQLEDKKVKKILVGNSATSTNNHFEALEALKRINLEDDFEIICPLSYGDKNYAEKVMSYGNNLFGERFKGLTNWMLPSEYGKFLLDIDVAIFNFKRQQGLGNIISLFYLGKKIYIRSDSPIWHFTSRLGLKAFDFLELLSNNDVSDNLEFFKIESSWIENNMQIVKNEFSEKKCKELWEKVFQEVSHKV
ncbi:MAG: TDP-N-acetylfucosamine:lipid II N-acetylfucosaminyltransferase [Fervidobacterium sp.]